MLKREAKHTTVWANYLRENKDFIGLFEVKQTRTEKLYFNAFEPQQIDSLMAYEEGGYVHKFSDSDPRLKMGDISSQPPGPAYVVIRFPECFVAIRIIDFVNFINSTEKTFITYDQSRDIASKIVHVKKLSTVLSSE
jgi:hypothetical protein